jgi:tetratricopeptide (TPR) repeat protein
MLVIGTRKEHFEAVWVKNEWSRFLAIMKKDRSRLLIPCYRDMDAYDIPDELSNLQSQDMSKVGFIQDILRGVKKVLDAGKSVEKAPSAAAGTTAAPGVESLMKRGKLFLEDEDWKQADEYFDKVLDIDPEYAPAYVGKLRAELEMQREEWLGDNENPISELGNFQKAVRFADAGLQAKLRGYDEKIRERLQKEQYDGLVQAKNRASTEEEYQNLSKQFRGMNGYENTVELAKECDNSAVKARYKQLLQTINIASTEDEYQSLSKLFRGMNGYKNTAELASECDNQYRVLKQCREEQERIEKQRREEQERIDRKKDKTRKLLRTLPVIIQIGAFISLCFIRKYDTGYPGGVFVLMLIIHGALFCWIFFTNKGIGRIIPMLVIVFVSISFLFAAGDLDNIYLGCCYIIYGAGSIIVAIWAFIGGYICKNI